MSRMSRNTSVTLGTHFVNFIETQIQGGRYGTTSDVIRAALRLLEEHETRMKTLQEALIAGERSGEPQVFDSELFLREMRTKHAS